MNNSKCLAGVVPWKLPSRSLFTASLPRFCAGLPFSCDHTTYTERAGVSWPGSDRWYTWTSNSLFPLRSVPTFTLPAAAGFRLELLLKLNFLSAHASTAKSRTITVNDATRLFMAIPHYFLFISDDARAAECCFIRTALPELRKQRCWPAAHVGEVLRNTAAQAGIQFSRPGLPAPR